VSALSLIGATARLDGRGVLSEVDLSILPGEVVALTGPNGAGKTSVIRAMTGVLPLSGGEARLEGRPLAAFGPRERAARLAWLPQDRRIAWNMPAVEVAALGAPFLSGAAARDRALAALMEIDAGRLAARGVAEMSGGERARVLFARFLATEAPILLADEPAAGLDPDAQLLVMDVLRRRAEAGAAVLVSLHDLSLAARHADRVVVMDGGRIAADGAPREALAPEVMRAVFGVGARWLETPQGPVLNSWRL
jgi:iron complex transport system ATP-binding protein